MQVPSVMFSDGAAYERLMGRWSQKVATGFLDWLAVPPGLDWLDVGCGNGAFSEVIQDMAECRSLTGIDPSEAQIDYARHRKGADQATFHVGDAQELPFPDASFDATVMGLVIVFIPDQPKAVSELARVTRPGGMCATYMWDLPGGGFPLTPLLREIAALGYTPPMPPGVAASSKDGLERLWREAGFDDVATETFRITVSFEDFGDFWQSSTAGAGPQAALLKSMSEDERERLRGNLQRTLPTNAEGRISYPAVANAVKGIRRA